MRELKELMFLSCLVTLVASAVVKGPTEEWSKAVPKSVYSRALGPPPAGMGTISVPYMPKSPFFPKFVDPRMMIAKKTDILSNLFGGLGPAMYNPDLTPVMPYGSSDQPVLSTADGKGEVPDNSIVAPWLEAAKADEESSIYKRGIFGPFSPKFGPMAPSFGPMSGFGSSGAPPDYSMSDGFSRKRRSVEEKLAPNVRSVLADGEPDTKHLGPPPAYPTLSPISEEPEIEDLELQKAGSSTVPKEYLPGMVGPVGPLVDPSMFIAKKYAFLDTLFKNIATSTPSPTTTVTPAPKSTIVPPSFWFPTAMVPSPTEYSEKVSDFLDKLFESLKLNKTTTEESDISSSKRSIKSDSGPVEDRIARSVQDLSSITAAKDTIVDTILSELEGVKNDMMTTMDDLIAYQKSTAPSMAPKKAFKPFAPGMWPKPAVDVTLPFKQRMMALGQVFDMLTELQKNITTAMQAAIKASATTPPEWSGINMPPTSADIFSTTSNYPINLTLLDAIKKKLSSPIVNPSGLYESSALQMGPKTARMVPQSPMSFWVSYPESEKVKREISERNSGDDVNDKKNEYRRAIKMQMHQGYQNMPPGAIESVQAGEGSTPDHQGGIKLLGTDTYGIGNKWFDWAQYAKKNEQQEHRHNHHHH